MPLLPTDFIPAASPLRRQRFAGPDFMHRPPCAPISPFYRLLIKYFTKMYHEMFPQHECDKVFSAASSGPAPSDARASGPELRVHPAVRARAGGQARAARAFRPARLRTRALGGQPGREHGYASQTAPAVQRDHFATQSTQAGKPPVTERF